MAKQYEVTYYKDGEEMYKCELEVTDLSDNLRLFNMAKFYNTTKAYKSFVFKDINTQLGDYSLYLLNAKTKKEKKDGKLQ